MKSLTRYTMLPAQCMYLPNQSWRLEYEAAVDVSPDELLARLKEGWRRFGYFLFRPVCATCTACQTLRVLVDEFSPNRSQRRVLKANSSTTYEIGRPELSEERVAIFMRNSVHHAELRAWPEHSEEEGIDLVTSFVLDPLPLQEWSFYIDEKLVGVMYVDVVPEGFSAVYSYHDPDYRRFSLGTFMILSLIQFAAQKKMPHVYLGYYIKGCLSMEYKSRFAPNEVLGLDGVWRRFFE